MRDDAPLPLFPLPNVVHFPRTDLRLHVFEPRYRQMVRDLARGEEATRLVGMVLLKNPLAAHSDRPTIYPAGTAGRVLEIESLADGRSNILLRGDFRFWVEQELDSEPYRKALVRRLEEPAFDDTAPGVTAVHHEILKLVERISKEVGDNFPVQGTELEKLKTDFSFEELVNALAANLDLPVLRKLQLLHDPLTERSQQILLILRNRQRVLDLLRPYRSLAKGASSN